MTSMTKKVLAALALLFVGYTIGANYTTPTPVQSDVSNELDRLAPAPVATGCWVEHKADGTAEVLSGDLALMPVGSELISCGGRFQVPGDNDDDLRGNAPKYTEMHGDTRGRASAAPAPAGAPAAAEKPSAAPAKPVEPSAAPAAPTAPSSGLVNLNTASQEQLEALPGVGEKTAQKIIAARPLASVGAVDALPGVGSAMFGQIKDLVTV